MGLFGKIKNILFEDDEELVEEMPVYTKEDVEEKKEEVEVKEPVVPEQPITTTEHSRFSNVKRDVFLDYEDDVLEEVAPAKEKEEVELPKKAPVVEEVKEEKKSPFPSFDEDEFERINSRLSRSDNRIKKEEPKKVEVMNVARRANSNFSSTTTVDKSMDKPQINSGTLVTGKKPFTPSPVISPVYGILGENYKKDDIVDKKDGMKREPIAKPVLKEEKKVEVPKKEEKAPIELPREEVKVNIDSVRQKAYGSLDKLEEDAKQELKEESVREKPIEPRTLAVDKVSIGHPLEEPVVEEVKVDLPEVKEEISVEDQIENEEPIDVSKILDDNSVDEEIEEKEEKEVISRPIDKVEEDKKEKKPQKLDELEKTSTLQILDDIEKELNSIKPISKVAPVAEEPIEEEEPEKDMKTKLENNDTLENDLFNLIDSMYEEGEEEDNG